MKITIREFQVKDVNAIFRVEKACYPPELRLEYYQLIEILGHPDVISFVVENQEKVIIGSFILKLEKFKSAIFILSLGILPTWRKKGLGKYVLNMVFSLADQLKVDQISVQMEKRNQSGVSFFLANEFIIQQELEDFFFPGNEGVELLRKSKI